MDIIKLTTKILQVETATRELSSLWNAFNDPLLKELRLEKEGFIQPPPNPKYYRLYGHYLCPYVERALLALAFKKVPYQFVSIDFPSRPKWYYDLPSKGKVPLLEFPNQSKHLPESANICIYLDENFNTGMELIPKDNEELKGKILGLKDIAGRFEINFYKFRSDKSDDAVKALRSNLEEFNGMLKDNKNHPFFFDQPHPTLADILILPHFHRIILSEHTTAKQAWAKLKPYDLSFMMWWYTNMMLLKEVLSITTSKDNFVELEKWQIETNQYTLPLSLSKPPL